MNKCCLVTDNILFEIEAAKEQRTWRNAHCGTSNWNVVFNKYCE